MSGQAILAPAEPTCDVYAYAKRDLQAGTSIKHAIGSAELYGLAESLDSTRIPISLLENETVLKVDLAKDKPLTFEHLDLPDCPLTTLWLEQQEILNPRI